ncbi:MAG TPA: rhomboid family intramembrane serine protease [Chitinophagaceae bacterium]|nr:rhomboid family intramembrane serine protease [Chitinophagaceae bacterium]
MSYYQQQNRRKLSIGEDGNALTMLIAINLTAFVLLAFIKVIYYFTYGQEGVIVYTNKILNWVALPADFNKFLTRPWTLLTHMFAHDDVWHIVPNMLWLWAFGYILQDLTGNKKIFPVFLYGALAGALAFMVSYNIIPGLRVDLQGAKAIGASAGIMSIAIATTVMAPNYRIFPMINGGIPLWVITMIFVIIDLATIPYNNAGGHVAHLAGAGAGFLFMFLWRKGYDGSLWMDNFFSWVNNLFNPDKPKKGTSVKTQLFYKSTVPPYKKRLQITQQKVDEILEKIHQKGYQSLTEDEKDVLKRASTEEL